ncbi:MAG: pyridoxal-dependent decarboxylase [Flavobacterium sp.]|jgi:glutamate/tyrosine decarboxylase-like PLP-dependent enzyme|uniref:Aspartate aminotransferase family protein n=1 Tax=Flavobacterium sandaracinum TaxID=2541733 RepID=A0A4R5CUB3_9FLAO|nr:MULTISPECIES: pyridoxal-dependent decarboxylase [Flavobacterium]MDP3682155.1 pyridoxal-dependent decarboxylase [Flavobacterium sp.]OUD32745.1 aspartate aminotransferase family protein [Flavobacterium sp. FPG59]TDE03010.1 aspartate aminotransferase family protein [Flavobacterium sandaracinum]
MQFWKKITPTERQIRIQKALGENVNFSHDASLGYPASKLDGKVFNEEVQFLKDAPILQTYVANPNHIGCHTFGTSEKAFRGTQEIEREVLNVLAIDVFKAEPNSFDGYIAPGGTEANIQAIWMYRNYFMNKLNTSLSEIAIIASEDTHYSIPKAANVLMLDWLKIPVDFETRAIDIFALENSIINAKKRGKKYFIVVSNMGTTMFGAIDNPNDYIEILEKHDLKYKLHIDAAYGGFVYPFSNNASEINFENPKISSITIDAHKMLQAPYGTGVFICRKGLIENVLTKEAEYVEGMDLTLCGSRSGANAVAVWMILFTYGPFGWCEKIRILQMRTEWLCEQLDALHVKYFREPFMNIATIQAEYITPELVKKFDLVPKKHDGNNQWYKIVIMDHVEIDHLMAFITDLKTTLQQKNEIVPV